MSDLPSPGPPVFAGDLEYLRKQAKALLRDARGGDTRALAQFRQGGIPASGRLTLAHAQLIIAREAGFPSWPKLADELRWRNQTRRAHRLGSAGAPISGAIVNSNESLNLGGIDQIGLSCTDLEVAEQFYSGVLGLRPTGDVPGVMTFFNCDGVALVLFKADSVPPNSIIYFQVPPQPGLIEHQVATLKAKGVTVESDPHVIARNWNGCDVWFAFFRDPFGNLLALKSDVPVK